MRTICPCTGDMSFKMNQSHTPAPPEEAFFRTALCKIASYMEKREPSIGRSPFGCFIAVHTLCTQKNYCISYAPFTILTAFGALFGSPFAFQTMSEPVRPSIEISVIAGFNASQISEALISAVTPALKIHNK